MTHVPASSHGGGLPSQWMVDANGNVTFAPTDPLHNGFVVIQSPVGADVNETDAFYIKDDTGAVAVLMTGDGGIQATENVHGTDGFKFQMGANSNGFIVRRSNSANIIAATDAGQLGFYNHAPAAQQSVTSGTVTPEQLALALQANGSLGGT